VAIGRLTTLCGYWGRPLLGQKSNAASRSGFGRGPNAEYCRANLEPSSMPVVLQVVDQIAKTASEEPQERFLAAETGRIIWNRDIPQTRAAS
jgi:hypothetical protein